MRHLLLLLSIVIGISVSAQELKRDIIPIEQLQAAADNFAGQRWGNVDAADPIPYFDPQGNIIAYGFNYALDKKFPANGETSSYEELNAEGVSKNLRWGVNEYAHIVMGNDLQRTALFRFIAALSDEYAYKREIHDMAVSALGNEAEPDKIYFSTPMLKYYKYVAGNQSAYIRIFPPQKIMTEQEFEEEFVSNFNIDVVSPKGSPDKWAYYLEPEMQTKNVQAASFIPSQAECVPFLDWSYGCSPTAGAMLLDYWDNYSDYSASNFGNLTKHHFHRYDPVQGDQDYNVPISQEACADQMGTDAAGSTNSSNIGPGIVAAANSAVCGSYSFSQTTTYYDYGSVSAKWIQQKGEINASRPWHCGTSGHSTTAIGYEITGGDSMMILHNTWNPPNDWWNYTLNYRITKIFPSGAYGTHVALTSPNGDPGYNHNGDGEDLYSGNVFEITWGYDAYSGSYCKLMYSTNAGSSWSNITYNTPNDGSYLWTIPAGLNSSQGRVKIEVYTSGGTLIASDGSWGNFNFLTGGSIVTLSNDVAVNTTDDPTYYKLDHSSSTWGAVGIRTNDISTSNWSLRFYSSSSFATEVETSTYTYEVDFVVFDQHHLSNVERGIKTYRFSGAGNARTEFEGGAETITVGSLQTHFWTLNDVVEIWDVYLAAGTYKFSMNYNSGSANLDMALFSSNGGGPYYMNRNEYLAHSTNSGTANESFFVTVPAPDYYGFVVWANDASSASVNILAEATVAGLWEGDVNTNWNLAGNWNDNNVPTSSTDVVIPSGTLYSPVISNANANAKTLTVNSGATLSIGAYHLYVQNDIDIYGTLDLTNTASELYCYGDISWESGSQASMTGSAEMFIHGDWDFKSGANVHLNAGYVEFEGTSLAYIRSYEASCYFNNVRSYKTNTYIGVSNYSDEDLTINGNLYIYPGSSFNSYSDEKIIINGFMNNMGGHFLCNFGTFEFAGSPAVDLKPNIGDYFNNLIISTSNTLGIVDTYSDSLVIKGSLTIQSGVLNSNANTIVINGNWLNNVGVSNFYESTGTVIFNGSSGYQLCYGDNFYNVIRSNSGGYLHFEGPTNIYNNCDLHGYTWANDNMYIDNCNMIGSGSLRAGSGAVINIDDLNMGTSPNYGGLYAYSSQIYVDDLVNDGLYGWYLVSGSTGLIDITQGTSAGEYIDLSGSISIVYDGTMNIHGGSLQSYWPYAANASITMSSGVLDFTDQGIRIHNSGSYTLTTNITGGIIRTPKSVTIAETWNPAGGTLEFYGTGSPFLSMSNQGAALYNLHVNKTSGVLDCSGLSPRISNDVIIDGGTFASNTDTLYVGGDWTNNVGTYAFYEYDNYVCFYGPNSSTITTDEEFDELLINKSYSGFDGVVQATGTTVVCLQGSLHVIDGTYEMDSGTSIYIDNDLTIEIFAGFNANDGNLDVSLGGNLVDYNATINTTAGLAKMTYNTINWTFIGTGDQNFNVSSADVEFGNLIVDKTYLSNLNVYDNLRVNGDLLITSGDWIDIGTGQNYYLEGDLTVGSNGAWFAYDATVNFEGNSIQHLDEQGYSGYFGNIIINNPSAIYGVNLDADLIILNYHDLTINSGHLWANGNLIRVVGDIHINSSGELNMDDDSELNIGSSGHLNIIFGGVLELIGSQGHEVVLESNDATYWQFNCFSGGTVSAEWASFEDLDHWGVFIFSGGVVDTSHTFNHCTFLPGQAGGSLLWVENSQIFTVNYANFPSQGVSLYNVRKGTSAGQVTMMNYLGSFSGEAYDYDPNNNVIWTTDLSVSASVTNVSCNGGNNGAIDITVTGGTPSFTYLWNNGSTLGDRTNLTAGTYTLTATDSNGATDVSTWTIYQPAVYTVTSYTHTDVSCNGGSNGYQSIFLSGGTAPDEFLWSNGITDYYISNVPAGTYTLTCTDYNGCVATGSFIITQPPALNLAFTSTNVSCFGGNNGAIDLIPSGGTAPYTYNWTGGATTQDRSSLAAGNFTVTVTDFNGCTATGFRTISQPMAISITGSITHVTLIGGSNGSVAASASGGTPPYSYSWGGGQTTATISGLYAGTYVLTVMDSNGCGNVQSFTVNDGTGSTLAVSGVASHVYCYGQSTGAIDITVTGGTAPYSYLWNNGSTLGDRSGLAAGTYNITVTDAMGSTATGSWTITQPVSALTLSFTSTNVSCFGGNNGTIDLTPSGGTAPYTYNWAGGETTQDRASLAAGNFTVTVTDFNGCTATGFRTITQPVSALALSFTSTNVSCFGGSNGSIDLTISGGTAPYTYNWTGGATTQDRSSLASGNYTVTVTDANGCSATGSRTITQPANLVITYTKSDVTTSGGSNGAIDVTVAGGIPGYSYLWSNGAITQDVFSLIAGFYSLTVTDSNGCTAYATIEISEPGGLDVQNIILVAGWSIMSTYINPVAPSIATVFSPVVVNTAIVKSGSGSVYWPTFGVNSIGNMILGQGYQVKMISTQTLAVEGTAAVPELTPISIPAGWSIIGYLRQVPGDAAVMMSPIVANIVIMKNGSGQVYWPAFGVNAIGNIVSGQGYQIRLIAASTLTYPANSVVSKSNIEPLMLTHFRQAAFTDNNMTIGIPTYAFEILPMIGDEIGVFNHHGQLVGSAVFYGGNLAIPVWGDDELTPETEGLATAQDFTLRIWDGQNEQGMTIELWTEGDGLYEHNAIQIVGKVSFTNTDALAYALEQNVPNPFRETTRITLYLPETSEINITIYDVLGNVMGVVAQGEFQAGQHTLEVDGGKYATGNYFYRLVANDFVCTKQMEVAK